MDLLKVAGVDVSDWSNGKGGKEKAASNPKYCYNWAFIEPNKVVVLTLWHDLLPPKNSIISRQFNARKSQNKRAKYLDEAIQTAIKDKLPIRAIIQTRNNSEKKPASVSKRLLDTVPWSVTAYDWNTGECILTRGVHSEPFSESDKRTFNYAEEIVESENLQEGAVTTISINAYERNPEARRKCIERWGAKCSVCKMTFERTYGALGHDFIHVHHLTPIAAMRREYIIDPEAHLRPVCPNCHAMIHRRNPPYTIDELREIMTERATR
ncbi:MAG: HNH endonuclease [Nitrospirae bacterium]|nr:HNH endonuclease [Nitrospirota bacterium]